MQYRLQNDQDPLDERHRYEVLLQMADLVFRHPFLPELFRDVATRLRQMADFQFLNFSVYDSKDQSMHVHWWQGPDTSELPKRVSVSESPSGWVREQQEEILFSDVRNETRFPTVLTPLKKRGIQTYYVVPLTTAQSRLGALGVASAAVDAYWEADKRLLRRVGELVALAVENTMTREALQGEKLRLQALLDVNRTLASSLEMQRLLPLISECVTRVVPHDFAGVTLYEGDQQNMKAYVLSPTPTSPRVESGRSVSIEQTLSAKAFLEKESQTLTRENQASFQQYLHRILNAGIRARCAALLLSKALGAECRKQKGRASEQTRILNQIAPSWRLRSQRAYRRSGVEGTPVGREAAGMRFGRVTLRRNHQETRNSWRHCRGSRRSRPAIDGADPGRDRNGQIAAAIHHMSRRRTRTSSGGAQRFRPGCWKRTVRAREERRNGQQENRAHGIGRQRTFFWMRWRHPTGIAASYCRSSIRSGSDRSHLRSAYS
jgi:hypothetical protein